VLADACLSLLGTAHPLHTFFGPYYRPEAVVGQRIRSFLPSPIPTIRPEIPGTSIGIRIERQQYFTSPILREELMKLNNVRSCFSNSKSEGWMPDHVDSLPRRSHQIDDYVKSANER
jgi:hypothetical protein